MTYFEGNAVVRAQFAKQYERKKGTQFCKIQQTSSQRMKLYLLGVQYKYANYSSYTNITRTNRFTRNKRFNRLTTDQDTNRFTANTVTDTFTNTNITSVKRLVREKK